MKIYETDHSKFGGLIFPSDFNTNGRGKNNYNGSPAAKRIADDDRFDQQCKKNKLNHQKIMRGGCRNA